MTTIIAHLTGDPHLHLWQILTLMALILAVCYIMARASRKLDSGHPRERKGPPDEDL